MPIQLKPKEIQAFKRHLEDLGLPSVATYRAWCQDHAFDPAVKKHWRDRRQEQLAARRMGTKDEDEDALKAHIAALGLDSTSEYQIWCRTNGFSGKLYKTPSQRVQERRMLGQLRRQAQQAGSLRHTRKTGTIEQIYAGDLDGEHPAHPYLHIIHNHFQTLRAADQPDIADAYLAQPQPDFTMKGRTVDSMLELVEDRHGEKLAEMWNDSDGEWPGTWTSGMPMTAQNIRDWHDREEYLTVHVWDAGDKIAGYCSLIHKEDEDEVVYLPLLNVSPHFQGKSLGRKILVNAVEKTIDEKKYRLDLDTWLGNFKAMSAYKRTGIFWDVGPWPLLRNFMPAILQMPCSRYFFDKHDWYSTLQGDLTHVPDDEQWDGLNVFIYRFDSGDDQLTVWADREARCITAVDTAEAFVAAPVDHAAMEAVLAWTVDVIAAWEKEEKKKW